MIGSVLLTVMYFVVLPPFAWLARRASAASQAGWVPISRARQDASAKSQY